MTRHFLRDDDLSPAELIEVLDLADRMKAEPFDHKPLAGPRTVALVFDRPTLRTQVSFAAGIAELGGNPMTVDGGLAAMGSREGVEDVARVLGRQAAAIVWRTAHQSDVVTMAEHAGVPVLNALTDEFHPCQLLADLQTVREHKGRLAGVRAAFVGDGACNMGNSWVLAGAAAGMHVVIGAPEGFTPDADVVATAREIAQDTGGSIELTVDPVEAVDRRRRRDHRLLGQHGPRGGVRGPAPDLPALRCDRGAARPRRPGGHRHALPARLPRQGDLRGGHRGPAVGRLGRGGEPPARPEGRPRLAPGATR